MSARAVWPLDATLSIVLSVAAQEDGTYRWSVEASCTAYAASRPITLPGMCTISASLPALSERMRAEGDGTPLHGEASTLSGAREACEMRAAQLRDAVLAAWAAHDARIASLRHSIAQADAAWPDVTPVVDGGAA